MRHKLSLACVLSTCLLLGTTTLPAQEQPRIRVDERANPWTHLNLKNDPEAFQFAIVTDRTGGHRPGVFPEGMRKLNLLQPEFVMSVGDLIEGGTEDLQVLDEEWTEFDTFLDLLDMPFFYLPGNHDISNQVMAGVWEERFGRSYYHFVYHDVLFIGLNSEDTKPSFISQRQRDWLAQTLQDNPSPRWTLVFVHKPLWTYTDAKGDLSPTGWEDVESMLKGRQHTVFAGHYHSYTKYLRNDSRYFVLATTGGGSALRGPLWGQFDHVVWVTMTDQGPHIANLMLEGIWDENVRTEETSRLMGPLISGYAVRGEPIIVEGTTYKGGASRLRLTNDADIPLRITGAFEPHSVLTPNLKSIDQTLAPNTFEWIDLHLDASATAPVDQIQPLVFEWLATYGAEVKMPSIEGRSRIQVTRLYDIRRRRGPVTIDGNLEEWQGNFAFNIQEPAEIDGDAGSWMGPGDCSWRFSIEADKDFLYVAIEVTDDQHVYKKENPWSQDGMELRIDPRKDPERSQGRDDTGVIVASIGPGHDPDDMVPYPSDLADRGIQAIGIPTPAGHAYEVAIPMNLIAAHQGSKWDRLRVNIAIDDYDEVTGSLAQLWWQPDWRDGTNFAGSGTFQYKR